ncbi:MAG: GAF domain-containing protein [Anaerolineae bacterium]
MEYANDPRLLKALSSLNRIGAAVNRIGAHNVADDVATTLRLIAESAIKVVPGASAVIYACYPDRIAFDPASRVSAGERFPVCDDAPRPNGLGMRALLQRRPVLSYEEYNLAVHPARARAGAKVAACFPLMVADQPLGALYIYRRREQHFTLLELLMLENFVNQAAMAIYHARQVERHAAQLARREDEVDRLRRAGLLISSRLGLDETLQAILQMALEVINAQYGIIRLVDREGKNLITRAVAGKGLRQPLTEALSLDTASIMSWVARHRQPVVIPDLSHPPWAELYYPLDPALQMRSEIAVPLLGAGNRLEGVLNLESPAVNAFSQEDGHLLQSLAVLAVIAIQESRLLDALRQAAEWLLLMPVQQVLERLTEQACDLLNAATSTIWIASGEQLVLKATSAPSSRALGRGTLPLYESLTGQAVLIGRPVIAEDVRHDPHFARTDLAQAHNWQSALIVPIRSGDQGKVVGAFSVYRTAPDAERFSESGWDEKVLTCLAHYAALALQNAARQSALQAAQEQHAIAETFAAVGDIAANLLHQLNNQLGTIPVRVQGIQDKCRDALEKDAYLANNLTEIERSASQAMATLRANLAHLHPISLTQVRVLECVQEALAVLPPEVSVQMDGLDALPPAWASRRGLTMIFTNLLENATEAMEGHGTVVISGALGHDNRIIIAVRDDGPGIPPEWHDRIFELEFSRKPPQEKRAGRLGFGLWWVKTWVQRLGGSVSIESDGRHGATFYLTLPCATPYEMEGR